MKKKTIASILAVMSLLLCSCKRTEPEYLIMAGLDNGFVAAYRAYFSLTGSDMTKISGRKYDKLRLGNKNYERIEESVFTFDVTAEKLDPDTWIYERNKYIEEIYDEQVLIKDLKDMGILYTGKLYIVVTTFDDYRLIQVDSLDGSSIADSSYAAFKGDERLELGKRTELHSIRAIYRHR